jgi:hypothetical protein
MAATGTSGPVGTVGGSVRRRGAMRVLTDEPADA